MNATVRDEGHTQVQTSRVVLNGKTGAVVSDHFGVAVEVEL